MTEKQWELYRLSVAENMPESPYKKATIEGIRHKLRILEMRESSLPPEDAVGRVNR